MSGFSDIPIRSNADTEVVDASWWNTIRTALIAWTGVAMVDESQSVISGTQASYVSISGLLFDHSVTRAVQLGYTIYRSDGTTSRREMGTLHAMYKALEGTWYYERESRGDDALGNGTVSQPLIVNASGQVQYKSDNFSSGTIRYKSVITFAKET